MLVVDVLTYPFPPITLHSFAPCHLPLHHQLGCIQTTRAKRKALAKIAQSLAGCGGRDAAVSPWHRYIPVSVGPKTLPLQPDQNIKPSRSHPHGITTPFSLRCSPFLSFTVALFRYVLPLCFFSSAFPTLSTSFSTPVLKFVSRGFFFLSHFLVFTSRVSCAILLSLSQV